MLWQRSKASCPMGNSILKVSQKDAFSYVVHLTKKGYN